MAIDYSDPKYRADYVDHIKRLEEEIVIVKQTEDMLAAQAELYKNASARVRGAGSMMIRCIEQLTSARSQKHNLLKELAKLKKEVTDREIKISEKEAEQATADALVGMVSPQLLQHLQATLLVGNALAAPRNRLERRVEVVDATPKADTDAESREQEMLAQAAKESGVEAPSQGTVQQPGDIPTELAVGDLVSNEQGQIFIYTAKGVEDAGIVADSVVIGQDNVPDHAILMNGKKVLIADF